MLFSGIVKAESLLLCFDIAPFGLEDPGLRIVTKHRPVPGLSFLTLPLPQSGARLHNVKPLTVASLARSHWA
jgi:hypothetical protein